MNIAALLQPYVADRKLLQEFFENLADQIPNIERDIARLRRAPNDKALIANLFRALHNIKGDASICQVDIGALIAHPIESLLTRLRGGEIEFSPLFAEVILLAMDRLELAVEALIANRSLAHLKLVELVGGLERCSNIPGEDLDAQAVTLIEAVTGFRPSHVEVTIKPRASAIGRSREQVAADLRFFRMLSQQFEMRSPLFKGRAQRLLQLALDTNQVAGKPVNPIQLEAAVYLHDIGMMFVPETVWLKIGKLSEAEKQLLHEHPLLAAGLLERMEGWQSAALMVAQHHEMPDGLGYPKGLTGAGICAGAKILAIVDAFEAVTLKHRDRGQSRSILRAIAEVNACDKQFSPEWISNFNAVIRRMLEA